ncbi:MAG: hypothetical protein ACSHXF_01395 [Aquaticitalea sp.]
MIATKLLGLSSFLTTSKKAKIAILAIEIGILAFAIANQGKEKKKQKRLKN